MKRHIVLLFLMTWAHLGCAFSSLRDLIAYTKEYPEYPDSDHQIWTNPEYTMFYRSTKSSWWEDLLLWLGLTKRLWSFDRFKAQVQEVCKDKCFSHSNTLFNGMLLTEDPDYNFIVIGDLFGSFFSLTRILQDLVKRGFVTEDLKISNPKTRIIFLGNISGTSPYSLETYSAILQLFLNNPDQVILLRGFHEDRSRWRSESLKSEVEIRSGLSEQQLRLFLDELDNFFNELPRVFVVGREGGDNLLLFGSHDAVDEIITASQTSCNTDREIIGKWCKSQGAKLNIAVVVENKRTWDTVFPTDPLTILFPKNGMPLRWDLISGQTRSTRQVYRCNWEGYALVHLDKTIDSATFEHIARCVEPSTDFACRGQYHLLTGKPLGITCSVASSGG